MTKRLKMLPTLVVAGLLSVGSAFAAATPASTSASPTSSSATAEPAAARTKHASTMHCEKEARAKKLSGAAEKSFVKECREGRAAG